MVSRAGSGISSFDKARGVRWRKLLLGGGQKVSRPAQLAFVRALELHLRHVHDDGLCCSLPAGLGGMTEFLEHVRSVPGIRARHLDAEFPGELQEDMENLGDERPEACVVFRVVHLNVSRWHGMDSAFLPHFAGSSIVVACQPVVSDADGALTIDVRPQRLVLVQCFTAENADALRTELISWRPTGCTKPFLRGCRVPDEANVVQQLLHHQLGDGLEATDDSAGHLGTSPGRRLSTRAS